MTNIKQLFFRQLGYFGTGIKSFFLRPEMNMFLMIIGLCIFAMFFITIMVVWGLFWVILLDLGNTGLLLSFICTLITCLYLLGVVESKTI